jgi:hypothetical protein
MNEEIRALTEGITQLAALQRQTNDRINAIEEVLRVVDINLKNVTTASLHTVEVMTKIIDSQTIIAEALEDVLTC